MLGATEIAPPWKIWDACCKWNNFIKLCSSKKAFYRQGISPGKSNLKFIYCFLANIEHPLRSSEKLQLYPSMRYMSQTREKWDLFWVELTFKGYEDTMIVCVSIFIFLFRTNGKRTIDESDLRHYYGHFFESTILKLLDHSYVQSSFATFRRHFDNFNAFEVTPYS